MPEPKPQKRRAAGPAFPPADAGGCPTPSSSDGQENPSNRPPGKAALQASIPRRLTTGQTALLIAVAGGSGSGKSWLARQLCLRLRPHAAILSLDDFYRDLAHLPLAERAAKNFDAPGAIEWPLVRSCFEAIQRGGPVLLPCYDFSSHTRRPTPRRWQPRRIVIIEGLWPWWRADLQPLYALKIFRAGPDSVRLARRLARDVQQRARTPDSVQQQWAKQVQPMYARYVRPQMASADVNLPHDIPSARLDLLEHQIRALAGLAPQ